MKTQKVGDGEIPEKSGGRQRTAVAASYQPIRAGFATRGKDPKEEEVDPRY